MHRFPVRIVPTLAVTVVLLLSTLAATRSAEEAGQTATPAAARPVGTRLLLPGFRELRTESVEKELELTDEQKEKLKVIGQEYYDQMRRDWTGFGGMSAEDRKKRLADIRRKNVERTKQMRKRIEDVLSPDQLERLKQINLRTRAAAALAEPRVLEELQISEAQRKRLNQIRTQLQERIRRLREESLGETLDVLTPEQREKLEVLTSEGFRVYTPGQAAATQ